MSAAGTDLVLIGKAGIAVAAAAAAFAAVRLPMLDRLSPRTFDRLALAVLIASRAAVAILVYGVLGQKPLSDVTVYATEGNAVLAGQVPFRDFFTAYSPLFPYLIAGLLAVWNDPLVIVCAAIVIEAAALPLWMRVARRVGSEADVRVAAVLAALSPIALVAVPLAGQNHVWLSLVLAASTLAAFHAQPLRSGLAFAGGVCGVKWLSLIHAPVLWNRSGYSWRWLAGAVVPVVILYAVWWRISAGGIATNASFHAGDFSSGNLPFLATLSGIDLTTPLAGRAANVALILALVVAFIAATRRHGAFGDRETVFMLALVTVILMLFSKKAHPQYILIALFPIGLSLAVLGRLKDRVLPLAGFLLFSVASTVESSLWYRWLDHRQLSCLTEGTRAGGILRADVFTFLCVEILLVGGYAWSACVVARGLYAPTTRPDRHAGAR